MVAIASVLFTVETLIQSPFPWIRLGLANIATLLALKWWGFKEAFIVVILRVVLGSLLTGKFFHPIFLMALSGGVAAAFTMKIALVYENRIFGVIGISVMGALTKNLTQLLVAYVFIVRQVHIVFLVPLFLFASLVGGIAVGFCVYLIDGRITPLVLDKTFDSS